MSTNIDSVDTISGQLFMTPRSALEVVIEIGEGELPGGNFLEDFCEEGPYDEDEDEYPLVVASVYDGSEDVPVKVVVYCYGECSGLSYDALIETVLPRTTGSADLIFCWGGGDFYSGVRVVEGVVTKHEVVMALGDEEKK